jgi:hypothetical protein
VFSIGDRFGAAASKAKLIGRRVCGVIAMFDLEANKAIASTENRARLLFETLEAVLEV